MENGQHMLQLSQPFSYPVCSYHASFAFGVPPVPCATCWEGVGGGLTYSPSLDLNAPKPPASADLLGASVNAAVTVDGVLLAIGALACDLCR